MDAGRVINVIGTAVAGAIAAGLLISVSIVVVRAINVPDDPSYTVENVRRILLAAAVTAVPGAIIGLVVSIFRLRLISGIIFGLFCGILPVAVIAAGISIAGRNLSSFQQEIRALLVATGMFCFVAVGTSILCAALNLSGKKDKEPVFPDEPPSPDHFNFH